MNVTKMTHNSVNLLIDCKELILGRTFSIIVKLFRNKHDINFKFNTFNKHLCIYFLNVEKFKNIDRTRFIPSNILGHSKFVKVKDAIVSSRGSFLKKILANMLPKNSFNKKILNKCHFIVSDDKLKYNNLNNCIEVPVIKLRKWVDLCTWYNKTFKNSGIN